MQAWFNIQNQCDTPYQEAKEEKPHNHINLYRKTIQENPKLIHDNNSQQTRNRREFPQPHKIIHKKKNYS